MRRSPGWAKELVTFSWLSLVLPGQAASSSHALRFLVAGNRNLLKLDEVKCCAYLTTLQDELDKVGFKDMENQGLEHSCVSLASPCFLSTFCFCLLVLASFFSYCRWASSAWKVVPLSRPIYRCLYSLGLGRNRIPFPQGRFLIELT